MTSLIAMHGRNGDTAIAQLAHRPGDGRRDIEGYEIGKGIALRACRHPVHRLEVAARP